MGGCACGIQVDLRLHLQDVSVPACGDSEEKELNLRS